MNHSNLSRIIAAAALVLGACAVQDDETSTADELTRLEATTQSACTVRTPTTWYAGFETCSYPWRGSVPLEIGDHYIITDAILGRGWQEVACTTSGLVLVEEVCLSSAAPPSLADPLR